MVHIGGARMIEVGTVLEEHVFYLDRAMLKAYADASGDQKFEIFRPVVAGDVFKCSATIETLRVAAGNEIVSVRSDLHNGSELVVSSWSTLVVRA